jgi:hypothetical protein
VSAPSVAAALEQAQAAKAVYRDAPDVEARAEHRAASTELRYARWVTRGGPAQETSRLGADQGHTNREVADLYARWLAENPEG